MSYENPQVPHEVNVSRESVLAEFVRLATGLCLVVLAVAAVLYFCGGALALPAGMQPVVHWSDTDVPNAFATLGGHLVITRGLYDRMPSENALAMVLAHELAHLRERDPISAVGGTASLALVLGLLGGDVEQLAPQVAHAVQLGYSRRAERRADEAAVEAIVARYGHAGGAAAVFEVLAGYAGPLRGATPTLLSTHPADGDRIARLQQAAQRWNPACQPLRPVGER